MSETQITVDRQLLEKIHSQVHELEESLSQLNAQLQLSRIAQRILSKGLRQFVEPGQTIDIVLDISNQLEQILLDESDPTSYLRAVRLSVDNDTVQISPK
jgi:predicted nucleic acid-binding protein